MKRMHRPLAALAAALMLMGGAASATEAADREMIARSVAMAGTMGRLAQSPYVVLMTESDEILDLIARIGLQAYDAPQAAYVLRVDSRALLDAAAEALGLAGEAWEADLSDVWRQRLLTTMPSMLSSLGGSYALAAASVVAITDSFVSDLPLDGSIVCLVYGDDAEWMVAAAFFTGGEGVITASAMPAQMTDGLRALIDEGGLMTLEALEGVRVDGVRYAGEDLRAIVAQAQGGPF